jgi:putative ABC transport system permease protein
VVKNWVLVALRCINRQKMYSVLNIAGLVVGLAAFILIALYVQNEMSFDRYHENSERIYRVVRDGRAMTPAPLGPAMAENFAEVEAVTRIIRDDNTLISRGDSHFLEQDFYWAGTEIFKVFSIPFVVGDMNTALLDPSSIVVSQSAAKKYFGDESPLGQVLNINDKMDYRVTGVFSDMPAASHFVMDFVVPYEDYFKITSNDITRWQSNFTYTYFLLREGADPSVLANDIHRVIETPLLEKFGAEKPYPRIYFLQALTDIHLKSHNMQEISVNNDMTYIYLFSSIAFLTLFIACINYVNLAMARAARRGKEVGMRKVVGARRVQLVQQFLGESFLIVLLALACSLLVVELVLPAFNTLVERQLSIGSMMELRFLLVLVLTVIFVSLLAGGYPAIRMSAFKPVKVMKGIWAKSVRGQNLRNSLVLFQFAVTTTLFICTFTINEQLSFLNDFDVGYNKSNIINLTIRDRNVRQNIEAIRSELLRNPDVIGVAASDRLPNNIDTFTSQVLNAEFPDKETTIFYNTADYDFVDLYEIEIESGRNFSKNLGADEEGAFLVNEAAVRAAGWDSPLEQTITHWSGETGPVVGVMKDFYLHSLHSPIEPLYIFLEPNNFSYVSIKVMTANTPATIEFIQGVMKKFSPRFPFEYSFFDEEFSRAYHPEQQMVNVFSSFAILAIVVACVGLFGLSAFAAQQRIKEIGIRKILGASVPGITLLLSREFVQWVILANLIAWPVAYVAMEIWLQNFAIRIDQSIFHYAGSAVLAFVIAVSTVSILSVKAAAARPEKALRYEH